MSHSELLLINGNVITMARPNTRAEAVAVRDGRIVSVGLQKGVAKSVGNGARVLDLQGKTLVPGFIDVHNHMMLYGLSLAQVDCRAPPIRSISEMVKRIRARAKDERKGSWVRAFGYSQFAVEEKRHPNRGDLDEATSEHPVVLRHFSFHAAVLNTAALALCGITRDTPDPPGGTIVRNPATKEPTGLLLERAQSLLDRTAPPPQPPQMKKAIAEASRDFVKLGITSLQDPGWVSHETTSYLRAYREAEREGDLLVRVGVMVNGEMLDSFLQERSGALIGDGLVTVGPVKLFADGVVNLRTAAMTEPYSDLHDQRGILVTDEEELARRVMKANDAGLQVAVHAIGDGAVDATLDAFEESSKNSPRGLRPRLIHAVILRPDQIVRTKKLRAVVDVQPIFLKALGNQFSLAVGPERNKLILPFRTLMTWGISLGGGSDAPCTDASPLSGVAQSMGRFTSSGGVHEPEQGISAEDALRMYTSMAAYNCGEEALKGSIEPGKLADLAVLSANPLDTIAEDMWKITVDMTIVGGRVVYEHDRTER